MGCAVSSQTVRPDISDGTGLQNRASNSQIVEKASASSLGGDAQNYDTQSTHGLPNDVSNMLSSPNEENTVGVHEGNSATCSSIESHLVDSTGLFYCDVTNIINPQNMIAAIKRGDTEVVKALCRGTKGQNASGINSLGMWNSTPLMIATQYARVDIAHYLLGQIGIEIDHVNDKGVTTLLIACADGHCDLVSRLLGMGAKIYPKVASSYFNLKTGPLNRSLNTLDGVHCNADKAINAIPLSVAVMNGHYKCVDALIRYGVEVNTRFDFPLYNGSKIASTMMTPIMLACMYGHNQMVNLLLAYKADCMLTDSSDSNVLHYALSEGPNAVAVFTILHTLLEETDLRKLVLIADKRGYTPLHNACISNHVDVIPVLVSLGCNIDARTRPPKSRENIIERTMHKPINLGMSFTPSDFCKSIRLIDQTDKEDEVEDVKSIGVSGDISKINGRPLPIHMPMSTSKGTECEASVVSMSTLQDSHGTPIVVKDFTLQSTILLKSEDKVKVKEKEREDKVKEKGREDKEKDGENNVVIGIDKKDVTDTLKTRRKSSLSSDSVGWGITPLHIAVKRRSIAAVTSLIAENADPRVKDDSGLSPLDMAKKLRVDSPILLLLTQAAAALQKLYQPVISIPITIPEESSGFDESEDGIEELTVKKLPTPKNVPQSISQNIPGKNITEKAVLDCSARNRVIENHIRGIVQVATQNVMRKTAKNTQKS